MTIRRSSLNKRIELKIEAAMWRFRLIAILPVIMSLVSSLATFILGTHEILKAFLSAPKNSSIKSFASELLGSVIGGIDLYLIGIALLIFAYGVYELLISPIDPAHSESSVSHGLLDIRNLDQLKEKLVKVLVVALIVSAFKAMLTLPIDSPSSLAFFCLSVLLLALSGWLIAGDTGHHKIDH